MFQEPLEEQGVLGVSGSPRRRRRWRVAEALLLVAQQHVQQICHLPLSLLELLHHSGQLKEQTEFWLMAAC